MARPVPRRLKRWLLGLAALAVVLTLLLYAKAGELRLGAEAYLYGYPLVMMDLTRAHAARTQGAENRLLRVRSFPGADFRDVVRPNVDTLYTSAFIDMAQGPWVFEMPPNALRYELMPFMDAWTNVFAAPGTRLNGGQGARLLLAAADWQGEVPAGLSLVRAPTRIVWLIGRTQTRGEADYPLVHRLQEGLTLRHLADWQTGRTAADPAWKAEPTASPPIAQMQAMATTEFFARLARLMVDNPPAAMDAPVLQKLEQLGLRPGQALDWTLMQRGEMALARWLAERRVASELAKPRELVNGWSTPPALLGRYGQDYNTRAVVAMVGLGANLPADAMYPSARVDGQGRPLNGSQRYRLHFSADALPPVQAFWSVTAYGTDDFLIANALRRHALGDRDPLVFNADGSLDLWLQAEAPTQAPISNWLPVRRGQDFLLNARLYWPRHEALDG
ncbi:MAG: DUF1254 domain-containing protein, partial [Burkholderiaceae bacterium]|nr:DUF1254 domain-containing protein [Burkholderiaceae bacterium]